MPKPTLEEVRQEFLAEREQAGIDYETSNADARLRRADVGSETVVFYMGPRKT